jgi:hypothetical protein
LIGLITAVIAFIAAPHAGKGDGVPVLIGCGLATFVAFILMIGSIFVRRTERTTLLLSFAFIMLAVTGVLRIAAVERASSNRLPCASNLRQLGLGIYMYARDHDGRLPVSLEELVISEDLATELLVCPSSGDKRATGQTLPLTEELKQPGHCSYIYLGAGRPATDFDSQWVLAYDRPTNHPEGYFVLFGDEHVEFQTASEFEKRLRETKQHLLATAQSATQGPHSAYTSSTAPTK